MKKLLFVCHGKGLPCPDLHRFPTIIHGLN